MKSTVPRPCHTWATRLAAAHPDDLTPTEHADLEAHLASCPTCSALAARYAQMDARILHSPAPDPLPELPAKLLVLWAEEDQAAVSEVRSASSPVLRRAPRSDSAPVLPASPVALRERQRRASPGLISLVSALAAIVVVALLTTALVVSRLLPGPSTGNQPSEPTQPTSQPATQQTVIAT